MNIPTMRHAVGSLIFKWTAAGRQVPCERSVWMEFQQHRLSGEEDEVMAGELRPAGTY